MLNQLREVKYHKLYRLAYFKKIVLDNFDLTGHLPSLPNALQNVFRWIKDSFDATGDGGSSAYYLLGRGWQTSYPETTGYLIPTIYEYGNYTGSKEWNLLAKRAADWLISIQHTEGGWMGLQIGMGAEPRIFNTGMILDGMAATYREEKDKKYLDSGTKAVKWIVSKMDSNGNFSSNNFSEGGTFDSLVVAGMLEIIQYLSPEEKKKYHTLLKRTLDNIIQLQTASGWFHQCNKAEMYRECKTSLLHHVGYTLDGLIRSSLLLDDKKYLECAHKTALKLMSQFEVNLFLPAFAYEDWKPFLDRKGKKASICITGYSQIAIVFLRLSKIYNDLRFKNAAVKINDIVSSIGNQHFNVKGMDYGLPGSYPINGAYQKYQYVNWAAKYHADSLLLSIDSCPEK